MAKTPASRKQKGRNLQDAITKALRAITGLDKDQKYTHDGDIQSRSMGASGTDVVLSSAAKQLIPFDIEAKNAEAWHIEKWWEQTQANTAKGRIGLLIIKKNRKKPLAVLDMDDLFKLTIKK